MSVDKRPIGIFDSGIGGLTVAKAVMENLPQEDIIYFGDTAHMPYGEKSFTEIIDFSIEIVDFLITQQCKLIIIACNSAASAAGKVLDNLFGEKVKLLNVIDPVVDYLIQQHHQKKVGVLCTDLTHQSEVFLKRIQTLGGEVNLVSLNASKLASYVEHELQNRQKLNGLIKEHLSHSQFDEISAMVLGCTHYVWIKEDFYRHKPAIEWIEPSQLVASEVEKYLKSNKLVNQSHRYESGLTNRNPSEVTFYQSGNSKNFFSMAKTIAPKKFKKHYVDKRLSDK